MIRLAYDADAARARQVVDAIREQTAPRVAARHQDQQRRSAGEGGVAALSSSPAVVSPARAALVVLVLVAGVFAAVTVRGIEAGIGVVVAIVGAVGFTALLERSSR